MQIRRGSRHCKRFTGFDSRFIIHKRKPEHLLDLPVRDKQDELDCADYRLQPTASYLRKDRGIRSLPRNCIVANT